MITIEVFMMYTLGVVILFCLLLYMFGFSPNKTFVMSFQSWAPLFEADLQQVLSPKSFPFKFPGESLHPHAKLPCKGIQDLKLINAFGRRYSKCAFVTWTLAIRKICNSMGSVKNRLANLRPFLEGQVVVACRVIRIISRALYLPFLRRLPITWTCYYQLSFYRWRSRGSDVSVC